MNQTLHHPSLSSHPYVNLYLQHVQNISHVCRRDLIEAYRAYNLINTVSGCWTDAHDTHTRHITGYQQDIELFFL